MPVNAQVQKVKLGPCEISFGGTDLGLTKGGVQVSVTTNTHDVTVDQFGQTAVNSFITGRTGTVTVPMAETDLDKLLAVIPGAVKVTGSGKTKLEIPTSVGMSLLDFAKELVLHPKANGANVADDVVVPLASPAGTMQFAFEAENERVYNVEFTMYPDEDGLLFLFGDKTATAAP